MSLRQIAKELGISPAYLSYMINGKRPWRKDLYQRYMGVVNTFVNSEVESVNNKHDSNLDVTQKMAFKKAPFERGLLKIAIGAEDEIRTRDFLLGKEVLYH
jgi:predicted transcriptional regulator